MRKLPICLVGAGVLGHTWVVTRYGSVPGEHNAESILGQCSYGADAVRMLDETMAAAKCPGGNFYTTATNGHGRSYWRCVSRAAALLDQPPDRPYEPAVQS